MQHRIASYNGDTGDSDEDYNNITESLEDSEERSCDSTLSIEDTIKSKLSFDFASNNTPPPSPHNGASLQYQQRHPIKRYKVKQDKASTKFEFCEHIEPLVAFLIRSKTKDYLFPATTTSYDAIQDKSILGKFKPKYSITLQYLFDLWTIKYANIENFPQSILDIFKDDSDSLNSNAVDQKHNMSTLKYYTKYRDYINNMYTSQQEKCSKCAEALAVITTTVWVKSITTPPKIINYLSEDITKNRLFNVTSTTTTTETPATNSFNNTQPSLSSNSTIDNKDAKTSIKKRVVKGSRRKNKSSSTTNDDNIQPITASNIVLSPYINNSTVNDAEIEALFNSRACSLPSKSEQQCIDTILDGESSWNVFRISSLTQKSTYYAISAGPILATLFSKIGLIPMPMNNDPKLSIDPYQQIASAFSNENSNNASIQQPNISSNTNIANIQSHMFEIEKLVGHIKTFKHACDILLKWRKLDKICTRSNNNNNSTNTISQASNINGGTTGITKLDLNAILQPPIDIEHIINTHNNIVGFDQIISYDDAFKLMLATYGNDLGHYDRTLVRQKTYQQYSEDFQFICIPAINDPNNILQLNIS